jgi:ABC-type iron transport system FetAB ATPase subunit
VRKLPEKWTWNDYRMEGPLPITLEDWTITAYGRENEIQKIVDDVSYAAEKGHRKLLRLIEWHGTGKSTFLYNVCYHINNDLFFGDKLENPQEGVFTHVLALYLTEPVPRKNFLEYVYNNGLSLPWGAKQPRKDIEEVRSALWDNCLRKLAFLYLRKALHEISKRKLQESVIGGSALTRKYYKMMSEMSELKTNEFTSELDKLYAKDKKILDELGQFMRYYARMLTPSIEERVGRTKVVSQEHFENFFPKLLYPVNSGEFLEAKHHLFSSIDTNLRRFTAFEKILKRIGVSTFVVMDEVEDWSKITKGRIDMDIHEIMTDAQSMTSLVMVFRTEVYEKIKKAEALERYMTIVDRFQLITLEELTSKEIEELTKGVLSTAREGKLELFPCTSEFVAKLASQTKRSGKFNIRQYIRTLMAILEESLGWSRPQPELTPDLLDTQTAKSIIAQIAKDEQAKAVAKIIIPEREA